MLKLTRDSFNSRTQANQQRKLFYVKRDASVSILSAVQTGRKTPRTENLNSSDKEMIDFMDAFFQMAIVIGGETAVFPPLGPPVPIDEANIEKALPTKNLLAIFHDELPFAEAGSNVVKEELDEVE